VRKLANIRALGSASALLLILVVAGPATGQPRLTEGEVGPPVIIGPRTGYSFVPTAEARGPLLIVPTLSLTGEYNDNIFLDNNNREGDFIIGVTPGIRVVSESERHRLAAGYSLTGEKYLDHDEFDELIRRHDFFIEGAYRVTPQLTLGLRDAFVAGNNTNTVNLQGISTGRENTLSNVLSASVAWRLLPRTSLFLGGSWSFTYYPDSLTSLDTDTYTLGLTVTHDFTPRLSGTLGYEAALIKVETQPDITTHTPRVGLIYRFTETLTGSLSGGPSFSETDGRTDTTAAITAGLSQLFRIGSAAVTYDRRVGTTGGIGGITDSQTVTATVVVVGLARNLSLEFAPSYYWSEVLSGVGVDVNTLVLPLRAAYQFNSWISGLIGYNFYRQRGPSGGVTEVDQNRIFLGLQLGYPIRKD
jgi:hypothetical protein